MQQTEQSRILTIALNYISPVVVPDKTVELFKPLFSSEENQIGGVSNFLPYGTQTGAGLPQPINSNTAVYNLTGDLFLNVSALSFIFIENRKAQFKGGYRSVQNYLKSNSLLVKKLRLTGSNTDILEREFFYRTYNIFGETNQEEINPISFKKPTQVQSLIIDIPMNFIIDKNSGFDFTIKQGEFMNLDFYCKEID